MLGGPGIGTQFLFLASDLRFRARISEPKTAEDLPFCGTSGDLAIANPVASDGKGAILVH